MKDPFTCTEIYTTYRDIVCVGEWNVISNRPSSIEIICKGCRTSQLRRRSDRRKRTTNRAQTHDLHSKVAFSHTSYGIGHTPATPIAPYVPVTGVPLTATTLRLTPSRLALVRWMVVGSAGD